MEAAPLHGIRLLVALAAVRDLLLPAKHLFVEAMATSLSPGSEAGASLLFGRCGDLGTNPCRCQISDMPLRRFSSAVATSREGHRRPRP